MVTTGIKRCNLMDKRLEEIIDSKEELDREEAEYCLLISDINELMLYDKRHEVEGKRILILGKQEFSILLAHTKRKSNIELAELYEYRKDTELDQEKVEVAINEFLLYKTVLNTLYGLPIFLSRKESFLEIVIEQTENTLDIE